MINNRQEMIVDEFYDLMTEVQQPVKHAAQRVTNKNSTQRWKWELAGTYIIADSGRTCAMASDRSQRLARFTAPPANRSQRRGAAMELKQVKCEVFYLIATIGAVKMKLFIRSSVKS